MLSTRVCASLGLLSLAEAAWNDVLRRQSPPDVNTSVIADPICSGNLTVLETTTIDVPVTHYVDVTVSHWINVTVDTTETVTNTTYTTESLTETVLCTVSITETETDTETETETDTDTDTVTKTKTKTTTDTVATTITSSTTTTVMFTEVDPCPTTCSVSVGTVNLYFWPTDRPYTYPSTWYDESLDYTFTSPSVYMLIPTAQGTNSNGPTGPSTSKWILPLHLDEVSTIVDGSITKQLTLSDIGTDCPQTAEPSAIATMVDGRCDPILAAPSQVKSWASPCNACGRFGLFDPPYAVPTLTGGLIDPDTSKPASTHVVPTSVHITRVAETSTVAPVDTETTTVAPEPETSSEPAVVSSSVVESAPVSVPTGAASRMTDGQALALSAVAAVMFML